MTSWHIAGLRVNKLACWKCAKILSHSIASRTITVRFQSSNCARFSRSKFNNTWQFKFKSIYRSSPHPCFFLRPALANFHFRFRRTSSGHLRARNILLFVRFSSGSFRGFWFCARYDVGGTTQNGENCHFVCEKGPF